MKTFLPLILTTLALTGCVHERGIYRDRVENPSDEIATQEPPEVIREEVTIAPSPIHLWIGGHWAWGHGAYHWAPGYWARRPHYYSHWSPGVWLHHGGGWRWRHGRWH